MTHIAVVEKSDENPVICMEHVTDQQYQGKAGPNGNGS